MEPFQQIVSAAPIRATASPTRPAAFAGRAYPASPPALRAQLATYFEHRDGAGAGRRPTEPPGSSLRGVLSPHIDFTRGGPVYTWAYRELLERSDADVFVILGVAHRASRNRFVLTSQDFETPLGLVKTDRAYVDRIAAAAGRHLFDDEPLHRGEHSVEFQAVFLKYVLGDRPFRIVPILVGSFHDLMTAGVEPIASDEVRGFVEALKAAEAASGKKVAYVGGIDLSHVGREFGDSWLVDDPALDRLSRFDHEMLDRAAAVDPTGWFGTAARGRDSTRVCGLSATYTMMHAMGPARGRLLRYSQAVDAARRCCVTFASVAYEAGRD